jgi:hypothetical protein
MRSMSLLAIAAALAGCSTSPPMPRSAEADAELQRLIAGRVAGQPISCLSTLRADNMVVIDDNTIAFRNGGRVYVNQMQGGCNQLGTGFYTLVTRMPTTQLCRGEIARVADLTTGSTVGSCVLGDFVPYSRP